MSKVAKSASYLGLLRVVVLRLLGLLLFAALQVLHVGDEDGADADAGQNAHDRRQDEHETDHDTLKNDDETVRFAPLSRRFAWLFQVLTAK